VVVVAVGIAAVDTVVAAGVEAVEAEDSPAAEVLPRLPKVRK